MTERGKRKNPNDLTTRNNRKTRRDVEMLQYRLKATRELVKEHDKAIRALSALLFKTNRVVLDLRRTATLTDLAPRGSSKK